MQNLLHEGLEIRVDLGTPGRIGFVWNGRATSKEPGKVLTPFFDAHHKNHFHLDMKARKRNGFCE
jgi:hypothetical protein